MTATQLWNGIAGTFAPLLGAALVLLIGWFLAVFLGQLIKKILGEKNIAWSRAFSGLGLTDILEDRLGLSTDVGAFLGWFVKWFLIIASFMAAISIFQLHAVNSFLGEMIGFLPFAVSAAMIVFLGFFFGKFIDRVIVRLIGVIGVKADVAGATSRWIIIAFSILAAARYLNLQLDLLWPRFVDFLVFAGAIAVGFGFSSRAGEWLENIKSRFQ
ncbi:MAG: Conserved TM helix repeat-containing protein [Parcubacteria group bacterium GW2011_GWA2_42_14]|nr:MAG: Conserved TM helix repeat-containing protein [Parcubacteria group bacterium GW2011_GWA2_42_14]